MKRVEIAVVFHTKRCFESSFNKIKDTVVLFHVKLGIATRVLCVKHLCRLFFRKVASFHVKLSTKSNSKS